MTTWTTCTSCCCTIPTGAGPCPECDAEDPGAETVTCPTCHGDGEYETLDHGAIRPTSLSPPYKTVRCSRCRGRGTVEAPYVMERLEASA